LCGASDTYQNMSPISCAAPHPSHKNSLTLSPHVQALQQQQQVAHMLRNAQHQQQAQSAGIVDSATSFINTTPLIGLTNRDSVSITGCITIRLLRGNMERCSTARRRLSGARAARRADSATAASSSEFNYAVISYPPSLHHADHFLLSPSIRRVIRLDSGLVHHCSMVAPIGQRAFLVRRSTSRSRRSSRVTIRGHMRCDDVTRPRRFRESTEGRHARHVKRVVWS
jgi:hypothetical protein